MPLYMPTAGGKLLIDANGNINATGVIPANSPTDFYNIAIGDNAMDSLNLVSGQGNIAIGVDALKNMPKNDEANVAIGSNALSQYDTSAGNGVHTAIGGNAGFWFENGDDNVFLGEAAGSGRLPNDPAKRTINGSQNVIIGSQSGSDNNTSRAVALGADAMTKDDSVALGFGSTVTKANQIMLGRSSEEVHVPGTLATDFTNTAIIGAVTINKISGRVNVGAGTASVVVTNNKVTANSRVLAVASQNDATGYVKNVVPGAGTFTINLAANATANMSVDFFVFN